MEMFVKLIHGTVLMFYKYWFHYGCLRYDSPITRVQEDVKLDFTKFDTEFMTAIIQVL